MRHKQVESSVNLFIYIAINSINTIWSKQRHRLPVMSVTLALTWVHAKTCHRLMDSTHEQAEWENPAVARAQVAAKAEKAPTRGRRRTDSDSQLLPLLRAHTGLRLPWKHISTAPALRSLWFVLPG